MIEDAKITFYEIEKCGYYRYGHEIPEFCNVSDMLSELKEWAFQPGMLLGETCPYLILEGESGYHTYCFDINSDQVSGDFLLTTWNETPSVEGSVASVNGGQPVGEAQVELTTLPDGGIPGYATYFWFIPTKNLFASVRFHHRVNGHANMVRYLNEFLAKFTRFAVADDDPEVDNSIVGYRMNDHSDIMHLYPHFKSQLYRKPGKVEYLKNNSQNIRKIIRKNKLFPNVPEQRTIFQSFLKLIGVTNTENHFMPDETTAKYEVNYTPTPEEVDQIITKWEAEHDTKWNDMGFVMSGESEVHWLSYSMAKDAFQFEVLRTSPEIVDGASLLTALTSVREIIFRIL